MRILLLIISLIAAILGLVLSILPFGYIAVIPIVVAFISGFMVFKISQKENKSTNMVKGVFLILIISLALTIYNTVKPNKVAEDVESVSKENQSDENSLEELESLEIEE